MTVINQLFDELVEKRPHLVSKLKSVGIYHNDLPDNDFDEVLKCVEDEKIGYKHHNLIKLNQISLLTTCIGKTYYEKIVENETIDFAFCYTSLHWMPEYRGLSYGLVYEELYEHRILTKWFDEMSDRHILSWLDLRYQELKHSGLISFNICTMTNFSDIVNKGWESLIKNRGLNPGALANVTIPVYFRSKKQVNKILEAVKDKFKVIYIEYMLDETYMDRPALKAVTYNQLLSGLSKYRNLFPSRECIDKFYEEFENECFKSKDVRTLHTGFEWILLQKV
jgi:hypothetical protein